MTYDPTTYWNARVRRFGAASVDRVAADANYVTRTQAIVAALEPCFEMLRDPVLDWGAGHGRFTRVLRGRGLRVTAVDASKEMTALASRQGTAVQLVEPTRLPFADDTFNGLFVYTVLQHVPDPVACGAELRRVLRPGAFLVVVEALGVGASSSGHSVRRDASVYEALLPGLKATALNVFPEGPTLLQGRLRG